MKKIKFLVAACIAVAFSASCSSDDSEDLLGGDLTARWNQTKTVLKVSGETYTEPYESNQAGCEKDYIEFTDSNLLNNVVFVDPAGPVTCEASAEPAQEYLRTDNTLVIAGGDFGGTYEIVRLTSTELRIRQSSTVGGITTEATIYLSKAAM